MGLEVGKLRVVLAQWCWQCEGQHIVVCLLLLIGPAPYDDGADCYWFLPRFEMDR